MQTKGVVTWTKSDFSPRDLVNGLRYYVTCFVEKPDSESNLRKRPAYLAFAAESRLILLLYRGRPLNAPDDEITENTYTAVNVRKKSCV